MNWKTATGTLALGLGALVAAPAHAGENGGSSYPHGAENWASGALPPPGDYLLEYANLYTADRLNDGDGNSAVPGFSADAYAVVNRYVHVTDKKILGANYAFHVVVPVVDLTVEAAGMRSHDTSVGDIVVDPLILGWHFGDVHVTTGLEITIPTGDYNKAKLANVGRNYWTVQPVVAVSYLSKDGIDASAKIMYDINTRNDATDYRSGNEFHVDYTLGKTFKNGLGIGVAGYYLNQTNDDRQDGLRVGPDGNRGKAFAIGPTVKYQIGKTLLIGAWQHETSAENRPKGDKFWLRLVTPL